MAGSDYGENLDVVAPGTGVLTACKIPSNIYKYYCAVGGTSVSAPQVAGLAALLILNNPEVSTEEIRQYIRKGAFDVGEPLRDLRSGNGRIDISHTLELENTDRTILSPFISSPRSQTTIKDRIAVSGSVAYGKTTIPSSFRNYVLEIAKTELETQWVILSQSTVPVQNGVLGYIDPQILEEDSTYMIRLKVYDQTGWEYSHLVSGIVIDRVLNELFLDPFLRIGEQYAVYGSALVYPPNNLESYYVVYRNADEPNAEWLDKGIILENEGLEPVDYGIVARFDTSSMELNTNSTYDIKLVIVDEKNNVYEKLFGITRFFDTTPLPCPEIQGIESELRADGKYNIVMKLNPVDPQYRGYRYFFFKCDQDQCSIPLTANVSNPYYIHGSFNFMYDDNPFIDTNLSEGYRIGSRLTYEIQHGFIGFNNLPINPRTSCEEYSYTVQ